MAEKRKLGDTLVYIAYELFRGLILIPLMLAGMAVEFLNRWGL